MASQRDAPFPDSTPAAGAPTGVAGMQSFWGLLTAYWRSDRKAEAWGLSLLILAITWFVAKVGIWMAEAAGAFENAKASYQTPGNLDPWGRFADAAAVLVAMLTLSVAAIATRHFFTQTLHRRWRGWLNEAFTRATLSDGHAILNIQSNRSLDSIDQRQQECLKTLTGNSVGLAVGIFTVLTATFEVSRKLWKLSSPVDQLPALGGAGGFVLTLGLIVPFAVLCTWGFTLIGRVMRDVNKRFQEAEGAFRGELNTMFRRAAQITASAGERAQGKINRALYADIDRVWHRSNVLQAGFMGLHDFYMLVSFQVLASLLALPAYAQGQIDFQTYVTIAALVGQLTNGFSWLIDVTPALAALRADVERVTDYAAEIEQVQDARAYFRRTGIHDFTYRSHAPRHGIVVRNLELMHEGADAAAFLRSDGPVLHFPAGSWTALIGCSGGGKTSFLNALMAQKDYGRAEIWLPEGPKPFYACQDLRIPTTSLKQLVAGAEDEDAYSDAEIAAVLAETGLGFPDFLRNLNETACNGRPWERALSGGQKKRLFLARLLLHRPKVAFLDEVTSGLDPAAQQEFYDLLRRHCPGSTIIASIHNRTMPTFRDGTPVFDFVAEIEDAMISIRPHSPGANPHLFPATAAGPQMAARLPEPKTDAQQFK